MVCLPGCFVPNLSCIPKTDLGYVTDGHRIPRYSRMKNHPQSGRGTVTLVSFHRGSAGGPSGPFLLRRLPEVPRSQRRLLSLVALRQETKQERLNGCAPCFRSVIVDRVMGPRNLDALPEPHAFSHP